MSKTGGGDDYEHLSSQGGLGIVRTVELSTFVEQKRNLPNKGRPSDRISDELASIDGQGSSSRSMSIRGFDSEGETPFRHAV